MWEVFERLCKEKGVTPYRVGEVTGIKSSTFYGWKTGKYTPKQEKLQITECQPESAELQSTVLCGVLCTALKKQP